MRYATALILLSNVAEKTAFDAVAINGAARAANLAGSPYPACDPLNRVPTLQLCPKQRFHMGVIEQPPGRHNQNIHTATQMVELYLHSRAAINGYDLKLRSFRVGL